jgi:hypothetical protein
LSDPHANWYALLGESPGTAARLRPSITDLIRTAERAGYASEPLKKLLE